MFEQQQNKYWLYISKQYFSQVKPKNWNDKLSLSIKDLTTECKQIQEIQNIVISLETLANQ